MKSRVPGLRYTKNVKPILAELDTYRLSEGDIIMGLNLAIIEYRKRFRRIPNSREYPMLFLANQFDVLFLIISMADYRKLSEFIDVGYMIDPQTLIGYTPFYIEIQDDGVHAKLIPEPTGRQIRICPNCKRKFMQGTVADFVYNIGSNHFCGDKCRKEYVEKMLPGLGIVVPIE
jgi:hypothetical protein